MPFKHIKKATRFAFDDGGSLKARVFRSGLWVGLSQAGLALLTIVRSVALARLLSPSVFGLMSLAMIVVRTTETFTRPGVAQALIARDQSFEEASSTAFSLLVIRGVLMTLLLCAVAPWVARFYEADDLQLVLQALSAMFVLGGFSNINLIAQQRELEFRRLTYISQITNLLGTVITVVVAYLMRSVWALVVGQLVTTGLNTLLSYYFVAGRVQFGFDKRVARELMTYGKFITGSSIVLFIAFEIDGAVIGKLLGPEQLGYYALGITIANLITLNLSRIASNIMMPAYSKLKADLAALRSAFLRAMSLVTFAIVPATFGLIVLADTLIYVAYGAQWAPAIAPLQISALFGLFRALLSFNGYLFEGIGMPKVAFNLGLLRLAIVAPAIVPAVQFYGLMGAATVVTVSGAIQWLAGLIYLRRVLSIPFGEVARSMWRPIWTGVAMSVVVVAANQVLPSRTLLSLLVMGACGVGSYALLNLRFIVALKKSGLR